MSQPRTLADLGIGAEANVSRVRGERGVARRLMEMGILPGTRVRLDRVAPMGDPLQVRVRGYALSIRRAEARGVELVSGEG